MLRNVAYYDTILKVDLLVQNYIIDAIAKDISTEAVGNLKLEIDSLRILSGAPH